MYSPPLPPKKYRYLFFIILFPLNVKKYISYKCSIKISLSYWPEWVVTKKSIAEHFPSGLEQTF